MLEPASDKVIGKVSTRGAIKAEARRMGRTRPSKGQKREIQSEEPVNAGVLRKKGSALPRN